MRKELPKQYDPTQVESQIYQMWLDSDCFNSNASLICTSGARTYI